MLRVRVPYPVPIKTMSNRGSQKEKQADPQHGNKYLNYFGLAAPYIFSLILLIFSFVFFLILSLWLLLSGDKLVELYLIFIYLPIYSIFLIRHLLTKRSGKE